MIKVYKYEPVRFLFAVVLPVLLSLFVSLWAGHQWLIGQGGTFHLFVIIFAASIVLDNFFALTRPSKVVDDGEFIEFHAFGRVHRYEWAKLNNCRIRQYPLTKQIYLRIGNTGFTRGRYWLKLIMFNDGDDLLEKLRHTEARLHPEIKERMRTRPRKRMLRER